MRKLTLLIVAGLLVAGCAGPKPQVAQAPAEVQAQKNDSEIPDFVLNPPQEAGVLYGTGIAEQQSAQLAKETADLRARKEIATILGQKISTMLKDFLGQAGLGTQAEVTELSQSVTRAITNTELVGVTITKRAYIKGKMYSLAKYPLDDSARKLITDAVSNTLSSKQALLSQFRAKQGFEELDKELDKMKTDEQQ
jgi:uncharacterized lipoprotein YmbA